MYSNAVFTGACVRHSVAVYNANTHEHVITQFSSLESISFSIAEKIFMIHKGVK